MDFDPFDHLGVAPAFDLDEQALQRAYLAATARLHPDLGEADPDALARLNEARAALADPERRAAALLVRLGGPSKEADRSLPPDFLMKMMQTQEAIDDARAKGADLDEWRRWAARERTELIEEVGALFRDLPADPASERLQAIRLRLNAWRYIERIIEQLAD